MILPWTELRVPTIGEWLDLLGGTYEQWGYLIVLFAAAIENTFLVTFIFPGGTMVVLGGVYARLGVLDLPYVILLGWVGTFAGASFDYAVGRWNERTWLRRVVEHRHLATPLDRAGEMLRRYGPFAFLAGHFIPQIRSLIAVAAGVTRMPYWRFVMYEAPAALVWASVYALGGYLLAEHIPLFEYAMQRFGWAVALIVGLFFFWKLWLQPRAARPVAPTAEETSA